MADLDSEEFEVYIEKVKILGLFNVKRKRKRLKNTSSVSSHGSPGNDEEAAGNNNKTSQVPKLPEITTSQNNASSNEKKQAATTTKSWHHNDKRLPRHNNLPPATMTSQQQHGYDTLFERPSNIRRNNGGSNLTLPPIHPRPPQPEEAAVGDKKKRKKKIKFHFPQTDDVTTSRTNNLRQREGERKRMARQQYGADVITMNGGSVGKKKEARMYRKSSLPAKLTATNQEFEKPKAINQEVERTIAIKQEVDKPTAANQEVEKPTAIKQETAKLQKKKRNMEDRRLLKKRESDPQVIIQRCRYKKIVNVYLDQRWHKERREQFYRKLEAQQNKMMNERRWKITQREKGVNEALERQREQLNELRQKHALEKEKRIATQHVKWKFISEENDDRTKYGLPNTISIGTSDKKLRKEQKCKSSIVDIRRRNEARYEYIFQSANRPPLSKTALQLGR